MCSKAHTSIQSVPTSFIPIPFQPAFSVMDVCFSVKYAMRKSGCFPPDCGVYNRMLPLALRCLCLQADNITVACSSCTVMQTPRVDSLANGITLNNNLLIILFCYSCCFHHWITAMGWSLVSRNRGHSLATNGQSSSTKLLKEHR